jgi:hypothetical protein
LYVLKAAAVQQASDWNELPEPDGVPPFDVDALRSVRAQGDQPLYENHGSSAQQVWETLPRKQVISQVTSEETDGRQLHVEWGRAGALVYVYCANTFDQRQLVLIEPARASVLETYYREITRDAPGGRKAAAP